MSTSNIICFYSFDKIFININVNLSLSSNSLKSSLLLKVKNEFGIVLNENDYLFYVLGSNIYITNENIPLEQLKIFKLCKLRNIYPKLQLIKKQKGEDKQIEWIKKELILAFQINSLLNINKILNYNNINKETLFFQYQSIELKKQMYIEQQEKKNNIEILPKSINKQYIDKINSKILITITYLNCKKTFLLNPTQTIKDFKEQIIKKFTKVNTSFNLSNSSDYILKVQSNCNFLYGDEELVISFIYIQQCIKNCIKPDLLLYNINDITIYTDNYLMSNNNHILLSDNVLIESYLQYNNEYNENIDISSVNKPFIFTITSLSNIIITSDYIDSDCYIYIRISLLNNGKLLSETFSSFIPIEDYYNYSEEITFDNINISNIVPGTRIYFTIYKRRTNITYSTVKINTDTDIPIYYIALELFDYKYNFINGIKALNMWDINIENSFYGKEDTSILKYKNIYNHCSNNIQDNSASISIEIDGLYNNKYIIYPFNKWINSPSIKYDNILKLDNYNSFPCLIDFLYNINWSDNIHVVSVYNILQTYPLHTLLPIHILNILQEFNNPVIINTLSPLIESWNEEIIDNHIIILIQLLKQQTYITSLYIQILLKIMWKNFSIGIKIFWLLKSELHNLKFIKRLSVFLETYCYGCGNYTRKVILNQEKIFNSFIYTANCIRSIPVNFRRKELRSLLQNIKLPNSFYLPNNPKYEIISLNYERCKYMDSKKLPLWLNFNTSTFNTIYIFNISKSVKNKLIGFQLLNICTTLWSKNNFKIPYIHISCIRLSDEISITDVIKESKSLDNIIRESGGVSVFFKQDIVSKWLKQYNPSLEQYTKATENLLYSLCGFCVRLFIMQCSFDNSSILLSKTGIVTATNYLNRSKISRMRERQPIPISEQLIYCIGGYNSKMFEEFVNICCSLYEILFINKDILITLMTRLGISKNIVEDAFPHKNPRKYFAKLIRKRTNNRNIYYNGFMPHILAHNN